MSRYGVIENARKKKAKKAGGAQGGKHESMDNNVYFVPEVAKIVIDRLSEKFPKKANFILDACAGPGALGEAVYDWYRARGELPQVFYQDLAYTDPGDKQVPGDILKYKPGHHFDLIICNPPFIPVTLPEKIYHHLFDLLSKNGVLFFMCNSTFFYQGWERAIKLKYTDVYFMPRYIFDYGINKKQKKQKTKGENSTVLLDCQWIVCPADCKTNKYIHIPRDIYNETFF